MSLTLLPSAQWAQHEFACAPLGDARRSKRLVNIATHLARTRQACRHCSSRTPRSWIIARMGPPRIWGVIGDGRGRGFEWHSALAVRIESWTQAHRPEGQVVGLFEQQGRRPSPRPPGKRAASV